MRPPRVKRYAGGALGRPDKLSSASVGYQEVDMEWSEWISGLVERVSFQSITALLKKLLTFRYKISRKTALDIVKTNHATAIAQVKKQLAVAQKALEEKSAELDRFKNKLHFLLSAIDNDLLTEVAYGQLTAEYRDNHHAQALLDQRRSTLQEQRKGIGRVRDALQVHSMIPHQDHKSIPPPRIRLYTVEGEGVAEMANENRILAELKALEQIPAVKQDRYLLPVLQRTIRFYEKRLDDETAG